MGDFTDSFNFAVGVRKFFSNDESLIDLLDNPYIQLHAIQFQSSTTTIYNMDMESGLKLVNCIDLEPEFMSMSTLLLGNELCFENKSKVNILASPQFKEWDYPMVRITKCDPASYHGTCKSEEEIDQFLKHSNFYVFNMQTAVDQSIFSDEVDYFPIL
jgi:hypothetical protein